MNYSVKSIFFGKFDKIGSTSLKTKIFYFCEKKNLKNGVQRLEFKTWFFAFFCKNPKVATLDFLYKIQENRVYCKINLLVKFHLIGYTIVNTKSVHFCDKT